MERIKSYFKGDPYMATFKEYEKQAEIDYGAQLSQKISQFDGRLLKVFGDRFSPEVCNRVNKYFPTMADAYNARSQKFQALVYNWPRKNEVFWQRYGSGILGGLTTFSALYMTAYFRRYFRLQHYARFTMYATTIYFPAVCAGIFNQFFISNYMVKNGDACLICLGLKNSAVQLICSAVYPFMFACGMGMFYSTKYLTYKFPLDVLASRKSTIKAAKLIWEVINFRKGMFLNVVSGIVAINAVLSYYIAEQQQKETYAMYRSCLENEEELVKKGLPSKPLGNPLIITSKKN